MSDKSGMTELLKDRVRRLLRQLGKTPADVTRDHGFARTMIYDILGGRTKVLSGATLPSLAHALGVTPESLMTDRDGVTRHLVQIVSETNSDGARSSFSEGADHEAESMFKSLDPDAREAVLSVMRVLLKPGS